MTVQVQAVLKALLLEPHVELYGLLISERTGLLPGTTYPILLRLQDIGWVSDRWEEIDPHDEQRPRRRYYRLTPLGEKSAREALLRSHDSRRRTATSLGMPIDGIA